MSSNLNLFQVCCSLVEGEHALNVPRGARVLAASVDAVFYDSNNRLVHKSRTRLCLHVLADKRRRDCILRVYLTKGPLVPSYLKNNWIASVEEVAGGERIFWHVFSGCHATKRAWKVP